MGRTGHQGRTRTPAFPPKRETGTSLAIYCSSKSEGTTDVKAASPGRGGARNRADRVSWVLKLRQAQAIIAAGQRAMVSGRAFNRHVTIHWERADIADARAAKATGDIIKLASDWVRHTGHPMVWCWVRENDGGNGSKGSHVHMLLWCHPAIPIGRMWRRWIKRVSGNPYRSGTIKSRTIGHSLLAAESNPAAYGVNLAAVTSYIVKGVDPQYAATLGLMRVEIGGRVIGKRSAVCQALNRLHP
jgi:hypothetical protein